MLNFTELYQCEEITPPNLKLRNPSLCIIWVKTPEQSERDKETESEAGRVYTGIIFAVNTCAAEVYREHVYSAGLGMFLILNAANSPQREREKYHSRSYEKFFSRVIFTTDINI